MFKTTAFTSLSSVLGTAFSISYLFIGFIISSIALSFFNYSLSLFFLTGEIKILRYVSVIEIKFIFFLISTSLNLFVWVFAFKNLRNDYYFKLFNLDTNRLHLDKNITPFSDLNLALSKSYGILFLFFSNIMIIYLFFFICYYLISSNPINFWNISNEIKTVNLLFSVFFSGCLWAFVMTKNLPVFFQNINRVIITSNKC